MANWGNSDAYCFLSDGLGAIWTITLARKCFAHGTRTPTPPASQ
jgi:hypothetical protein